MYKYVSEDPSRSWQLIPRISDASIGGTSSRSYLYLKGFFPDIDKRRSAYCPIAFFFREFPGNLFVSPLEEATFGRTERQMNHSKKRTTTPGSDSE